MTIQQLRVALESARMGSITRAAANLFLSQPSASGMLRTLEKELGYPIFARTNGGIVPTEEGIKFLEHAKAVLDETEKIYAVKNLGRHVCLRLGVQNFSRAVDAFLELTKEFRDHEDAEFKCLNCSVKEGIRALYNIDLDVLAALIAPSMLPAAEQEVKNNGLELHKMRRIPVTLNLRRGHPLIEKLPPNTEKFDYRLLSKYPYAAYQKMPARPDGYTMIDAADQMRFRYTITVDERDTRCRVVSETDAFSIGCLLPESIQSRYRLECIPIPNAYMQLCCIMRRGGLQSKAISRYLTLLEAQFEPESGGNE